MPQVDLNMILVMIQGFALGFLVSASGFCCGFATWGVEGLEFSRVQGDFVLSSGTIFNCYSITLRKYSKHCFTIGLRRL